MLQAGYGGVDRSQMLTVIQDGITDLLHLASIAIEANGEEDVSPIDLVQGAYGRFLTETVAAVRTPDDDDGAQEDFPGPSS